MYRSFLFPQYLMGEDLYRFDTGGWTMHGNSSSADLEVLTQLQRQFRRETGQTGSFRSAIATGGAEPERPSVETMMSSGLRWIATRLYNRGLYNR